MPLIEVASPTAQFMPPPPEGVSGIFLFLVISIRILCVFFFSWFIYYVSKRNHAVIFGGPPLVE